MATRLSVKGQSNASAWNMAGNFGGGVLGAAVVLWLAQRIPLPLVGLALAAMIALPSLAAFSITEAPPVATHWFQGRFREFGKECLAVMRSPRRRWGVVLLVAPGCTCAAQPLLPALASHYGVDANARHVNQWGRRGRGACDGIAARSAHSCRLEPPSDLRRRGPHECVRRDFAARSECAVHLLLGHARLPARPLACAMRATLPLPST